MIRSMDYWLWNVKFNQAVIMMSYSLWLSVGSCLRTIFSKLTQVGERELVPLDTCKTILDKLLDICKET